MTAETNEGGGRAGKAGRAALKAFPLAPLALFGMLGWAAGVEYFAGHQPHGVYLTFWYAVGIVSVTAWFAPLLRPSGEPRRRRRWVFAGVVAVHMIAAASVCYAALSGLGTAAWNIGGVVVMAACAWSVAWTACRGFGAFKGLSLAAHGSGARLPLAALGVAWAIAKYHALPLPGMAQPLMPPVEILIACAALTSLIWLAHLGVSMTAPAEEPAGEYHLAA